MRFLKNIANPIRLNRTAVPVQRPTAKLKSKSCQRIRKPRTACHHRRPHFVDGTPDVMWPIADLSAKAYSHNSTRVQRHLCPVREATAFSSQAARLDTGLHGGTRGDGPKFHFGLGKRKEGNLYPQSGTACGCVRHDCLEANVSPLRTTPACYRAYKRRSRGRRKSGGTWSICLAYILLDRPRFIDRRPPQNTWQPIDRETNY
jgi:hypothetical protein